MAALRLNLGSIGKICYAPKAVIVFEGARDRAYGKAVRKALR